MYNSAAPLSLSAAWNDVSIPKQISINGGLLGTGKDRANSGERRAVVKGERLMEMDDP
ncbi:hypothetical protein PISMIDRAFT_686748 [Pisolithus microcarpus 441]|uniref:Unplaced genomic scaffold scaffold_184, whole genome shotgun sequence n=1 Tax=Pisolithus microcarpus 441 TaxID=765257 RepID=A0A0C9XUL5_9AGAM|nr:hypothetical protein PISMIDRAFT_686748 [Pisolithus microcarpus 441]